MRKNPAEAKALLVKYASLPPELAPKVGTYLWVKSTEPIDMKTIEYLVTTLVDAGLLKKPINAADMYIDVAKIK
jgi:hypothetical protein